MTTDASAGRVPADTLAHRLVLVRLEHGLSQRAAAVRCGLNFGEWQSMEDGRAAKNLPYKLRQISQALGYDLDWLLWGGPLAPHPDGPDGGVRDTGTPKRRASSAKRAASKGAAQPGSLLKYRFTPALVRTAA